MPTPETSGLLSTKEAAAYCRVSDSYFYQRDIPGKALPPYIRIGKKVFFRKADLDTWLESLVVRPEPPVGDNA
jgi:excisionase family DNA binding protein